MCRVSGNSKEALQYHKQHLDLRQKYLPSLAPLSQMDLGDLYYEMGQPEKSMIMYTLADSKIREANPPVSIGALFKIRIGKARLLNDRQDFKGALNELQSSETVESSFNQIPEVIQDAFRLEQAFAFHGIGDAEKSQPILESLLKEFNEGGLISFQQTRKRLANFMVSNLQNQATPEHDYWKKRQKILNQIHVNK